MKTVLMSVTDKKGIREFAAGLQRLFPNITFIASGGTAKALAGIPVKSVEEITNFPECFGGRVKTLHPKIMGGILYTRRHDDGEAKRLGISPIDMVVCNLYNFAEAAANKLDLDQLIEHMDIGGSTLIRSAVKNHQSVTVVVDPSDYSEILAQLGKGSLEINFRNYLVTKAINLSADYESMVAEELTRQMLGQEVRRLKFSQGKKLRYGENPDQEGWVYQFDQAQGIAHAEVLGGKELSYNNYDDATVAFNAVQAINTLAPCAVAVIKHGNLCGYAAGKTLNETFLDAWEGDIKSAFGSVVAFSVVVTEELIPDLQKKFIEVLVAPGFSLAFVEWAKEAKPNMRLLKSPLKLEESWLYKNISGGVLVQTPKKRKLNNFQSVTRLKPRDELHPLFEFAVASVLFAKSNAIAIVRRIDEQRYQLIGMGSGQPNRVDSLERLAIPKALENLEREGNGSSLENCILASDGFFPFDDSIRVAAKYGIKTCIQPGGSKNDPQIIATADELEICMLFTGERYFTH